MQYQMNSESVGLLNPTICTALFSAQASALLPDYKPSVMKTLCSDANVLISNRQVSGTKIIIEGCVRFRCRYLSENGEAAYAAQSLPFRESVDCEAAQNCVISVRAYASDVTARPASARKIDFSATVKLAVCALCRFGTEIPTGLSDGEIEQLVCKTQVCGYKSSLVRQFAVSDDLTLPDTSQAITEIVSTSLRVTECESRAVNGKLIAKGELEAEIEYYSDIGADRLQNARFTVPFSRVFDTEQCEQPEVYCFCDVSSYDIIAKPESDGSSRTLTLDSVITLQALILEQKEITYLCDAYSRDYDCKNDNKAFGVCGEPKKIEAAGYATVAFEDSPPTDNVTRLCAQVENAEIVNGNLTVWLKISASAIDGEGRENGFSAKAVISEPIELANNCKVIDIYIAEVGVKAATSASGLGAEVSVNAIILTVTDVQVEVISAVSTLEDRLTVRNTSPMVLCYGCTGERIWELAKHYRTRTRSIKALNGIEDDVLTQPTLLIIPTV